MSESGTTPQTPVVPMSGLPERADGSVRAPAAMAPMTVEAVTRFYSEFGIGAHPILKLPAMESVARRMADPSPRAGMVEFFKKRQQRIGLADSDPINWGFEAETWEDADKILKGEYRTGEGAKTKEGKGEGERSTSNVQRPTSNGGNGDGKGGNGGITDDRLQITEGLDCAILAIFGGNRAQKTWYAIKRAMQCVTIFPRTTMAILSESEVASIKTVQALAWFYLRPMFGHLNGKRDAVFKVTYSQAGGFTDRKVVLPNGSEVYFLTYGQDPGDFEGWEFGVPIPIYEAVAAARLSAGDFVPPNIGAVADESMRLNWVKMFSRRVKFRRAKLIWSFTPVKGITPAIKEVVGASAVTIESRASELLPRENIPGLPAGHMPYVQKCAFPKAYAIYFFTLYNRFGPSPERTYYQEVKELCEGKTSEYVERVAYGYARDSMARAFRNFGPWNIVKRSQLPAIGTNYMFTDPAGARNWATIWVRVVPGNPGSLYIYRDWPDAPTYGEWAVPTEREVNEENRKGWDGDAGPAQFGFSGGVTRYKNLWLELERIERPTSNAQRPTSNEEKSKGEDPYRRRLWEEAVRDGRDLNRVYEEIAERYVDPRAGRSEHIAEQGGTCIIDEFGEEQRSTKGEVQAPGMDLIPASGVRIEEGEFALNELLDWNTEEPLTSVVNQPHLFVCEDCEQVRWMFENYTGRGGEKGGCKDFADLARYMALAKLEHVDARTARGVAGAGF